MKGMPTEQELVARAREGDERAFEQLVADNEKRVYNLCRRLAGNPEDGAELAQEAFLNAWAGSAPVPGGELLCHLDLPAGLQCLHRLS